MNDHDQALEARARELLAATFEGQEWQVTRDLIRDPKIQQLGKVETERAIRAIVAALREGQNVSKTMYVEAYMSGRADGALNAIPDGYTLVPVEPTEAPMFGQIIEADFARNTLTMEMEPGYRAFAGRIMIAAVPHKQENPNG